MGQYLYFLLLLGIIALYAALLRLLQIRLSPLMGNERVVFVHAFIPFTWVFAALEAVFYRAVLEGTSRQSTGLIAKPAAAAMPAQTHGAQAAIEPAK